MNIQSGEPTENVVAQRKRTRVVRPYPVYNLRETIDVAATIHEKNSGLPFDRVLLAKAMGTTPTSSAFTMKLNASAKYGLTTGGYNDDKITLTSQGASVVAPKDNDERRQALLQAAMEPELFRRFYQMLDGKKVPEDVFAQNKLSELGVDPRLVEECLEIIKSDGLYVGLLGDVGGSLYVSLSGAHSSSETVGELSVATLKSNSLKFGDIEVSSEPVVNHADSTPNTGRIFIGHIGAPEVVDFIKTVLDEFDLSYGVLESGYDDQRPVNAEAAKLMRECDAAILVFARPSWALVSGGREISGTETMTYQLGAASVLYGDRVVSLTENGVELPGQDSGFQTLNFNRDRLGEIALVLLSELHRIGVIEVLSRPNPGKRDVI